ncbi:MAG: hypothetical protein LBP60_07995 [Spirochaetaceae bacterium]|jgi:hypothetical protein|nr:hypothetical protein [Spirochaetaceae bacterium]
MKPLLTIHGGEYLVGERLEKQFPRSEVWVPVKDTGTDLLLTNPADRRKNAGIQVKFSKDFLPGEKKIFQQNFAAQGWFNLPPVDTIRNSTADIWILAPYSFEDRNVYCVVLHPRKLADRLETLGNRDKLYLWITRDKQRCFAVRGLSRKEQERLAAGDYHGLETERDFSPWLENWTVLEGLLGGPSKGAAGPGSPGNFPARRGPHLS